MTGRLRPYLLSAAGVAAFLLSSACAGTLPWGAGGAPLETPDGVVSSALVRSFGPMAFAEASERLAIATGDTLAGGVVLPETTLVGTAWAIEWQGAALVASTVELALEDGRAVVRLGIPEQTAALAFVSQKDATYRCDFEATLGPGSVTLPLGFVVDKLGRVSAQVVDAAEWNAPIVAPAAAETCIPDAKEALGTGFALALPGAFAPVLGSELGSAFELGFAVGGASSVASDSTGAGVLHLAIRGDEAIPATFEAGALVLAWDVGVEAEAHPCMAPGALPAAKAGRVAWPGLADGMTALRLGALERVLQGAWLAGGACGDHATRAAEVRNTAAELASAWEALGRLEGGSALHLELWPTALPTLTLTPEGELALAMGALEVSLWGEIDNASWRLATMQVTIVVHGSLGRDTAGRLSFAASGVEVTPIATEGGLLGTPALGAVPALIEPLVEAIVADRAIIGLPQRLAPATPDVLVIVPSATGDEGDAWILFPP